MGGVPTVVNRVWLKDLICSGLGHTHTHTHTKMVARGVWVLDWLVCM